MKIKAKTPIIFLAFIISIFACKKEEVPRAELITSGSWKLIAFNAKLFGQSTDAFAEMEECEKDNLFNFQTDNILIVDEGPTKCDPDDPHTRNEGPWTLFDNDTKINMDSTDFNILELNESRFKISGTAMELGFVVEVEMTFGK